jgi:hypothetical protein
VRLLTLLTPRDRVIIERGALEGAAFHHADQLGALERALHTEPWTALVIDATLVAEAEAYASLMSYVREARLGVLLIAPVGHEGVRAVSRCARLATPHTGVDILLIDAEKEGKLVRTKLEVLSERSVLNRLLGALAPRLKPVPLDLGDQMFRLFGRLPLPRTAEAFAERSQMVRRSVDRLLQRAGLRPVARCIETIRLAWAWDFLRESAVASHEQLAGECGYASAQAMRDHVHGVLRTSPSELAQSSPAGAVFERLVGNAVRIDLRAKRRA